MILERFKVIRKSFLGIDIGVTLIKVVEISRWGGKIELKNYGQVAASSLYQKPYQAFEEEESFLLSSPDVSKVIRAILKEAEIKTREATFTIPDFSTFFTNFELPPMSEEEIPEAVNFEARRHIPVPVSDVVLDWFLTGGKTGKRGTRLKILLVAVPKEIVDRYQAIAKASRLELKYLEAEAFSLTRALIKDQKELICLLDIGAQSTTINIVDEGILKLSYSSDISGNDLTQTLAKSLSINSEKAELLKREQGLNSEEIKDTLLPLVNLIIIEMEKIFKDFEAQGKIIKKIIMAGGSSLLPGLNQYLSSYFKKEAVLANPFFGLSYPPILEKKLKKTGPSFSIAVGAALRGLM